MPIFIEVKVIPNSGRQECKKDPNGIIKCYLKSAPEGGKANAELIKFFSKKLGIPQYNVAITSGTTLRNKRIKIGTTLTKPEILKKLGIKICNNTSGKE
jgi:uncharacterized protein (TIGR00251 family)